MAAIEIILILRGCVTGGAGYISVVASFFMGALSGFGPGNFMATDSISIPAMKKSGFPVELVVNIEIQCKLPRKYDPTKRTHYCDTWCFD